MRVNYLRVNHTISKTDSTADQQRDGTIFFEAMNSKHEYRVDEFGI